MPRKSKGGKPPRKPIKPTAAKPVKPAQKFTHTGGKRVAVNVTPNEEYPHFRQYLPSGHPALVTAEHSPIEYKYRKVTHSERENRHVNEKVYPNPNPRDPAPMYIVNRQRHDSKKRFGSRYPWKYPKKDK
jgi:hypothetical protein